MLYRHVAKKEGSIHALEMNACHSLLTGLNMTTGHASYVDYTTRLKIRKMPFVFMGT